MSEDLSLGEQIEHVPLVDELDGPGPHDVEELGGVTPGQQDDLFTTVELDVRVLDHGRQPLVAQLVERRIRAEERWDVHGRSIEPPRFHRNVLGHGLAGFGGILAH